MASMSSQGVFSGAVLTAKRGPRPLRIVTVAAWCPRCGPVDERAQPHRIAGRVEGGHRPVDVRVVERLDRDLDLGRPGRQVDEHALVQDLDDVGALVSEDGGDAAQAAGYVGHLDVQPRQPAVADEPAHDHRGQQARIDVAAGEHHPDPLAGEAVARCSIRAAMPAAPGPR